MKCSPSLQGAGGGPAPALSSPSLSPRRLVIKRVPISRVVPWDKNPRGIKTKDFDRLKKQILKLGVYKPLVCYEQDGRFVVLGGNMRIRALRELGIKDVEISVVKPTSEAQKIEFALSDNDRAGFYEEDKLAELVYPEIQNLDLTAFKVDLGEALDLKQVVERFGPDVDDGADDVPEVDDTPAVTKMGDLFTLGKHRLLCGDSTKAEDVARLMRGERADMVFTDPPYGINRDGVTNDDLEGDDFFKFNEAWVSRIVANGNASFICYHSTRTFPSVLDAARKCGWTFGRMLWFYRPDKFPAHTWNGWMMVSQAVLLFTRGETAYLSVSPADQDTYRCTVKDLGGASGHPTEKIVEQCERVIRHLVGEIILDPFLGSGTTLIAAEKTGRVCYGLEIDPKYCDVIIKRYADYTQTSEESIRKTVEHGK